MTKIKSSIGPCLSHTPIPMIALLLFACAAFTANATGGPELFYSVGLGGYSPASYGAPEALELAAGLEFLPRSQINPSALVRLSVPMNPADLSKVRAWAGMELSLGYFLRHPFTWVSPRQLAWTPSIGAAFSARLGDLSDSGWMFSVSPVRLFTGRSYQSFGTIIFPFSMNLTSKGWGIRLLEFSYLHR